MLECTSLADERFFPADLESIDEWHFSSALIARS